MVVGTGLKGCFLDSGDLNRCIRPNLLYRHLAICSETPEDKREAFRSMKGYGAKPKGDFAQYWIDAAKELGLHDSHEGQGVVFFRNPLDDSPADKIDIQQSEGGPTGSVLVPAEDRHRCTDVMLLLLKQFEPCKFQTSDRKSSRSRDRPIGFPGLICTHCKQKRYFPITEKKFQDSIGLMTTHINNCFHAPLDVKASLCYLYHRSLLQRQDLAGQWKFAFFKGVWNRLHQHNIIESSSNAANDADVSSASASNGRGKSSDSREDALDEDDDNTDTLLPPIGRNQHFARNTRGSPEGEAQPNADEMKGMKDLIKAAALWLSERDAEQEAAQASRGARGKGMKRR